MKLGYCIYLNFMVTAVQGLWLSTSYTTHPRLSPPHPTPSHCHHSPKEMGSHSALVELLIYSSDAFEL